MSILALNGANGAGGAHEPNDEHTKRRVQSILEGTQFRIKKMMQESALDFLGILSGGFDVFDFSQQTSPDGWSAYPMTAPVYYRQSQKRGEVLPVYINEHQLRVLRDRSRKLCAENPFAQAAIENRVNYIVGEDGFVVKAVAATGIEVNPEVQRLIDRAQKVIDRWAEYNDLPEILEHLVRAPDVDGDAYVRIFPQDDGLVVVRPVESEHVRAPAGDAYGPDYSFGHQTEPGDILKNVGYWVVEDPLRSQVPVFVPHKQMRHVKRNTPWTSKRGMPLFYSCELLLRMAVELLRGVVTTANARARYAVIRKFSSSIVKEAVENMVAELNAATVTDPSTGEALNVSKMPFGSVVNATANQDYEFPSATIMAGDYEIALHMVLKAAAARTTQPEWMFTAETGGSNYSAALVAESPSTKGFGKIQKRLCKFVGINRAKDKESLAWMQIVHAVRCRVLHPDTLRVVALSCEGPTLVVRDKNSEAMQNRQYHDMKVKPREMIQQELGIDPDKAKKMFEVEAKEDAEAQKALMQAQMTAQQQSQPGGPAGLQGMFGQPPQQPGQEQEQSPLQSAGREGEFASDGKDGSPPGGFGNQTEAFTPDRLKELIRDAFESTLPNLANGKLQLVETKPVAEGYGPHKYSSTQFELHHGTTPRGPVNPLQAIKLYQLRIPDHCLAGEGVEGCLHVTAKYGLTTDNVKDVSDLVKDFGPVTVSLGRTSLFKNDEFDVLKIDVESKKLRQLNALIAGNLECEDKHPKYNPHVTVAYLKPGEGQKYVGWGGVDGAEFTFTKLIFSDKEGCRVEIDLTDNSVIGADGHDYKGQILVEVLDRVGSHHVALWEAKRPGAAKFTGVVHIHDKIGRVYDQFWVNGKRVSKNEYYTEAGKSKYKREEIDVHHDEEIVPDDPSYDINPAHLEPGDKGKMGDVFQKRGDKLVKQSEKADAVGKSFVKRLKLDRIAERKKEKADKYAAKKVASLDKGYAELDRDMRSRASNLQASGMGYDEAMEHAAEEAMRGRAAAVPLSPPDAKAVWDYFNSAEYAADADYAPGHEYYTWDRLKDSVRGSVASSKYASEMAYRAASGDAEAQAWLDDKMRESIAGTLDAAGKASEILEPALPFLVDVCYQAAKERGVPEEDAQDVAKWLKFSDVAYQSSGIPNFLTGLAVGLVGPKAEKVAPAIGNVVSKPFAQLGYLAYSGVRNPLATLRAARNVTLVHLGIAPKFKLDDQGNPLGGKQWGRSYSHEGKLATPKGISEFGDNITEDGKGKEKSTPSKERKKAWLPKVAEMHEKGYSNVEILKFLEQDPRFRAVSAASIGNWIKELKKKKGLVTQEPADTPVASKTDYDKAVHQFKDKLGDVKLNYSLYKEHWQDDFANAYLLQRGSKDKMARVRVPAGQFSMPRAAFAAVVKRDMKTHPEKAPLFDELELATGRMKDAENARREVRHALGKGGNFGTPQLDELENKPEFWQALDKASQKYTGKQTAVVNFQGKNPVEIPTSDLKRLVHTRHGYFSGERINSKLKKYADPMVQDGGVHPEHVNLYTMQLWPRFKEALAVSGTGDTVVVDLPGVGATPFNKKDVEQALKFGNSVLEAVYEPVLGSLEDLLEGKIDEKDAHPALVENHKLDLVIDILMAMYGPKNVLKWLEDHTELGIHEALQEAAPSVPKTPKQQMLKQQMPKQPDPSKPTRPPQTTGPAASGGPKQQPKSGVFTDKAGHKYKLEQGRRVPVDPKTGQPVQKTGKAEQPQQKPQKQPQNDKPAKGGGQPAFPKSPAASKVMSHVEGIRSGKIKLTPGNMGLTVKNLKRSKIVYLQKIKKAVYQQLPQEMVSELNDNRGAVKKTLVKFAIVAGVVAAGAFAYTAAKTVGSTAGKAVGDAVGKHAGDVLLKGGGVLKSILGAVAKVFVRRAAQGGGPRPGGGPLPPGFSGTYQA